MMRESIATGWPALSLDDAKAALTAPGAPFEMEEIRVRGRPQRVWRHAPPSLAVLADAARRHGERTFSVYLGERLSYEAHFRAVATLGQWLIAEGMARGDRVALAMRNLPEWTVAFFAVTAAGGIVVPLNAWWSGAELAQALGDSETALLICDGERHERLVDFLPSLRGVRHVVVCRAAPRDALALESVIGRPANYAALPCSSLPSMRIAPDDAAAIFYSSGTTGTPKGALASHRNILTNILSVGYAAARNVLRRGGALVPAAPRVRLITVPLFHVTGCLSVISGMPAGNTVILMHKWDPLQALKLIERERVHVTGGVPTIVAQLLDHPARGSFDLSSLETIAYGGAPAAPELARRTRLEMGAMPSTGWGMTETLSIVTALSAEDFLLRPESCGPPVPVADLKVMSLEGGRVLSVGEIGELWVKGPMVVQGYWNRGAAANCLVDGWLRTGDVAVLDDAGFCTIVDRTKDMIIRGGENIYSCEVENAIQTHPAVDEAALIGLPDRTLGEVPAAAVHLIPGLTASEAEIQAWVRERVASFKVPVRVLFVSQPLLRNAGGKIIKSELRALFTGF